MANLEALKQKIRESGMMVSAVAEKSGITRATLYQRLNGNADFRVSEALNIADTLHLSKEEADSIFFSR
jgi:predicted transcriptional regulator